MSKFSQYFFLVFFFTIVLDQFSKFIAGKFGLIEVNCGFSFGIACTSFSFLLHVFSLIGIVIFFGVLLSRLSGVEAAFLGAACSNLIDRVVFGGVRDWIVFGPIQNNLADWILVLSGIFICIVQSQHGTNHTDSI